MRSYVSSFFGNTPEAKSIGNSISAESQAAYEKDIKEHKSKIQGTPLYKHIWYVTDKTSHKTTVGAVYNALHGMHSKFAMMKAFAIDGANTGHRDRFFQKCPFLPNTDLKPSLHLGSTRIWNADGNIDEMRWEKLLAEASDENKTIFIHSKFKAYLKKCGETDPEEKETGRHTDDSYECGKKEFQIGMGDHAWDEMFEDLSCGWRLKTDNSGQYESYITAEVMREFFEDSGLAYKRAEHGILPVPRPAAPSSSCIMM